MTGLAATDLDTTIFGVVDYNQDNNDPLSFGGDDFTDQLLPSGDPIAVEDEPAGSTAEPIWTEAGGAYITGIAYTPSDPSSGRVISQSWEFGGFGGDQDALAGAYLDFFDDGVTAGPVFRRGDANGDGGFDISDAIFTLAALFTPGAPSPGCADSGDANDDGGYDISDAIFTLAALFTPGAPAPSDPGPNTCGEDPTADGLDCAVYGAACP
ncbi:MAG: hypothetical protein AAF488_11055 [Planctomycetota bacterium]